MVWHSGSLFSNQGLNSCPLQWKCGISGPPGKSLFVSFYAIKWFSQFSSVTQLCLTLCDPMNRSTPGLPVYHQLPEFTQTHAHWVGDAIQPSHPLSSPSPPAPNPSQHQGLFQWVNSSHEVAQLAQSNSHQTDWASSSSAQFWCCPPGGGARSHRGRAQTCKTEPTFHVRANHNPNYRSNPSTGCPLCFWPTGYGLESPVLLSGVINLLEWLTELRETLSSFLQKHVIQERKNEKLRARSVGRSLELRCPLRVYLCLPAPHLFTNQDVHWTLFFRGFMEVSLHRQE